jgi:PAS domain S-box-containing protein
MQPFLPVFRQPKIQTRLVIYYVTFAVITVATVIYFAYTQATYSLQTTVEDKLNTVAELKKDSLNQWVDEQQRNAIFLSSLPDMRSLSGKLLNPEWPLEDRILAHNELAKLLNIIVQRTADFQDIQIMDLKGHIVVSVIPTLVGASQEDQPFFLEGVNKTFTQTFYHSELLDGTTLTVSTPLFDDAQKRVGVLALHFNMKRVDIIMHEDPQLANESVKTHLVDSNYQVVTDDPILLAQETSLHSPAIDLALKGERGSSAYINQNGVQVIGEYLWIEDQNVALIVEIDRSIALQPARQLAINIGVVGALISIILIVAVIIMAQRITAPLRALNETVSHISKGQLDAAAPVLSNDEVGALAQAFNSMTEKLRQTLAGLQDELRERKQAEDNLLQFRKVMDETSDAIFLIELESAHYIDFNKSAYEFLGYRREELAQLSVVDIAKHIPSLEAWHERVKLVREQGGLIFETEYCRKDQTTFPVEVSARLLNYGERNIMVALVRDITQRKMAEIALRESEARIRALFSAFPDMIMELSLDGWIIHMVPPKGFEKVMPADYFIGKRISEAFNERTEAQTLFAMRRTIESNQINIFEFETVMGGQLHVMEARLVGNDSNTVLMMIRDITQRKWIEKEREQLIRELEIKNEESETLRRSLANIVGTFEFIEIIERILVEIRRVIPYDTASVWRVEGNQQYIITGIDLPPEIEVPGTVLVVNENNSAYPLIRGTLPYVLSNDVQAELKDFQAPHDYVQSWLAIPLKTRGNIIGLIALDGKKKDQFTKHHAELAVTFGNQVAIALDNARLFSELQNELEERRKLIAELEIKNAESETLRQSVAIVAATLEKSEAIDRILEQLERVVPFDSASVQLINGNMLEIVSMRGFDFSLNEADNRFELNENEPAYPVIRGDAPYVLYDDIQILIPAFKEFPHQRIHAWMAVPLRVKGQIIGIIALDGYQVGQFSERDAQLAVTYANQVAIALENARLFSDLQAELSLRKKLILELENKNAELERFTYTVSHDLKSPLFTIRGFLGYLEQDAVSGNQMRLKSDIQRITDATDKMQRLLNELLELSRVGRLKNESTYFSFAELASEASELVQGRIMERGIAVHIDPSLPEVYGDRPRLMEVLQNLLDNAAKFMGDQKEPYIEIGRDSDEDGKPIFYVRDNGMGIPAEHFDRVFGLFNKLDPKTDGTGIGLALVKRIIEVNDGRIWVQSEVGKGSTFFFTLPTSGAARPDSVI